MLLAGIVGVAPLEGAAESRLEAHDGGEDGLAGFALALHRHALSVTGFCLCDDLEVAVAVGVGDVEGAGGFVVDTALRDRRG